MRALSGPRRHSGVSILLPLWPRNQIVRLRTVIVRVELAIFFVAFDLSLARTLGVLDYLFDFLETVLGACGLLKHPCDSAKAGMVSCLEGNEAGCRS